jgi:dihydroorotate dehydrogenase
VITLSNGIKFDFAAASGALGFTGRGWLWEWPLRWLGWLDPTQFLVIGKTLTRDSCAGNLCWSRPWRCVRLVKGNSAVNAVGMTNPGVLSWAWDYYPYVPLGLRFAASAAPSNRAEAAYCARALNTCHRLAAVELNMSCSNVEHDWWDVDRVEEVVAEFRKCSIHPVIVKLAWQDDFVAICKRLDGLVDAFDLVNTVPWVRVFPGAPSPLARYGPEGSVSGRAILYNARDALMRVKTAGVKTPILSGGGVMSYAIVEDRFELGAEAVAFGSIFLRSPCLPNQIVERWRQEHPQPQQPITHEHNSVARATPWGGLNQSPSDH